jgi:uncharacterized protein YggU (UPF0235/DUF167 family)
VKITIIAHPNSKRPRVEEDLLGTLHVYVSDPPLEGRANMAIIKALAKHFQVNKSCVFFASGTKSKSKTFEIIKG